MAKTVAAPHTNRRVASRLKNAMKLVLVLTLPVAFGVGLSISAVQSVDVARGAPGDVASAATEPAQYAPVVAKIKTFTEQYCIDCHNDVE